MRKPLCYRALVNKYLAGKRCSVEEGLGSLLLTAMSSPVSSSPSTHIPPSPRIGFAITVCFSQGSFYFWSPAWLRTRKLAGRRTRTTQSRALPFGETAGEEEGGKSRSLRRAAAGAHPLAGFVRCPPRVTQCTAIKTAHAVLPQTVNYRLMTKPAWMSVSVRSTALGTGMPAPPRVMPLGNCNGSHHDICDTDCSHLDKLGSRTYARASEQTRQEKIKI